MHPYAICKLGEPGTVRIRGSQENPVLFYGVFSNPVFTGFLRGFCTGFYGVFTGFLYGFSPNPVFTGFFTGLHAKSLGKPHPGYTTNPVLFLRGFLSKNPVQKPRFLRGFLRGFVRGFLRGLFTYSPCDTPIHVKTRAIHAYTCIYSYRARGAV